MSIGRGQFITIEGIEGAGKSTCAEVLSEYLARRDIPFVRTREPGGTALGEDIRDLLLNHRYAGMSETAELLLMFAARAEHLRAKIEPSLRDGTWVLCDRFTDATYAYQGGGRGLDKNMIVTLETLVQGWLKPDLTLLLDLPVGLGLTRAGKRSALDRFEREAKPFFERVRTTYLEIANADPNRVKRVDSSLSLENVTQAIIMYLENFIRNVD